MYSHTQIGYAAIIVLLVTFSIMLNTKASWFMFGVIGICMILMTTLTVKVTDKDIVWFFGPYFLKKNIPLIDVHSTSTVKTSWYNGIGIRYLGDAVLYNVSGLKAVKIQLKSGDIIMIGTDEPQKLQNAINTSILRSQKHSAL